MSLEGKGQTHKRLPARPQITQQADGYGNEFQLIIRVTAMALCGKQTGACTGTSRVP